jgi:hypothetical protein
MPQFCQKCDEILPKLEQFLTYTPNFRSLRLCGGRHRLDAPFAKLATGASDRKFVGVKKLFDFQQCLDVTA